MLLPVPKLPPSLTLILDLDETLVFARNGAVLVRPDAIEFLTRIKKLPGIELVLWTAGTEQHAFRILRPIADSVRHQLGKQQRIFDQVITCETGDWHLGENPPKDLSRLGLDLSRVLFVDNLADNCRLQRVYSLVVEDFDKFLPEWDYTFQKIYGVVDYVYSTLMIDRNRFLAVGGVPGLLAELAAQGTLTAHYTLSYPEFPAADGTYMRVLPSPQVTPPSAND
jgi:hypothetical protein